MKNKFIYTNILLVLFLCMVGFSPQKSISMFLTPVYAGDIADIEAIRGDINTTNAENTIESIFSNKEGGSNYSKSTADILAGFENLYDSMGKISNGIAILAGAISVVSLIFVGFKIINSGKSNVMEFIRNKAEIKNILICIVFITVIPRFVSVVTDFKPPSELFKPTEITGELSSGAVSHLNGAESLNRGKTVSDLFLNPKSSVAESIIDMKSSLVTDKDSLDFKNMFTSTETQKGWIELIASGVAYVLALLVYAPIQIATILVGTIGFYPVSFDVYMYSKDVSGALQALFSISAPNLLNTATSMGSSLTISAVSGGLEMLTTILNVLYFIVKKFALICLEFVCYYFGISHLLNLDRGDVGKFLSRVGQGVVGMTLFPLILEFLLDIDGILAQSIMRITGSTIPGFGILNLVPTYTEASSGLLILVFSVVIASIVFMLSKTFFVRRVEISMLYVMSPVYFLKHMMSTNDRSVSNLFGKMTSAVFLTTAYAPLFAITTLMMALGSVNGGTSFIYLMLVLGILFFGKNVVESIISDLSNSKSVSSSDARNAVSKGFDAGVDRVKNMPFDVMNRTMAINDTRKSISRGLKKAKAAGKEAYDKEDNGTGSSDNEMRSKAAKRGAIFKSSVGSVFGSAVNGTKNRVMSKYWEKYGEAAKKRNSHIISRSDENLDYVREKALDERNGLSQDMYSKQKETLALKAKNLYSEKHKDNPEIAAIYYEESKKALNYTPTAHAFAKKKNDTFIKKKGADLTKDTAHPEVKKGMNKYMQLNNENDNLHKLMMQAQSEKEPDFGVILGLKSQIDDNSAYMSVLQTQLVKSDELEKLTSNRKEALNRATMAKTLGENVHTKNISVDTVFTGGQDAMKSSLKSISKISHISTNTERLNSVNALSSKIEGVNFSNPEEVRVIEKEYKNLVATHYDSISSSDEKQNYVKAVEQVVSFNGGNDAIKDYKSQIEVVKSVSTSNPTYVKKLDNFASNDGVNVVDYLSVRHGNNEDNFGSSEKIITESLSSVLNIQGSDKSLAKVGEVYNNNSEAEFKDKAEKSIKEAERTYNRADERYKETALNIPKTSDYKAATFDEFYSREIGKLDNNSNNNANVEININDNNINDNNSVDNGKKKKVKKSVFSKKEKVDKGEFSKKSLEKLNVDYKEIIGNTSENIVGRSEETKAASSTFEEGRNERDKLGSTSDGSKIVVSDDVDGTYTGPK